MLRFLDWWRRKRDSHLLSLSRSDPRNVIVESQMRTAEVQQKEASKFKLNARKSQSEIDALRALVNSLISGDQ